MKRVALACNQGLALLGFFPYTILFPQSQINNPDPQMFFFIKKKVNGPFHGWVLTASRLKWEPLWGGSLLFTIKFSEIGGTRFLSISEGQTTQILKSDLKKGVSVVAKMFSPGVDEGFWLYYTSFWYKNI